MSVTINVLKDTATPTLNALRESLTPRRLAAAVGPACARLTQQHLRKNGTNKRGWHSTQFWARAAKATNWQQVENGVVVSVNQIGVRQRYWGGEISPVNAKALSMPISPVSYGHVPADFPGLFVISTPKGTYLVQRGLTSGTKAERAKGKRDLKGNWKSRREGSLNFLFKLVGHVIQGPDRSVLPDEREYRSEANKAVLAAVIKRDRN